MENIGIFKGSSAEAINVSDALRSVSAIVVDVVSSDDIVLSMLSNDGNLMATLGGRPIQSFEAILFFSFPYRIPHVSRDRRFAHSEWNAALQSLLLMTSVPVLNRAFILSDAKFAEPSVQVRHLAKLGWPTASVEYLFTTEQATKSISPNPDQLQKIEIVISPFSFFVYPGKNVGDVFSEKNQALIDKSRRWLSKEGIDWITIFGALANDDLIVYGFSRYLPPSMPAADIIRLVRERAEVFTQ